MTIKVRYNLYRSNPLVLRELLIPSDFTLNQLSNAMCIGLGIEPSPSEMTDLEGHPLEENMRIEDLILTESNSGEPSDLEDEDMEEARFEGSLCIFQNEKTRQAASLILYLEIYSAAGEKGNHSDDGNEKDHHRVSGGNIPEIILATDYSLPVGIYQIAAINEIAFQISKCGRAVLTDGSSFYRELLSYNAKKIKKQFMLHFAPEHAGASLRFDVILPIALVLESRNLQFLKSLSDRQRCYPYQKKKQDYVSLLAQKLSNDIKPKEIFESMSVREYINFRTLVTSNELNITNQDQLEELFPLLNRNGLVGMVKKKGAVVAEDIIRDYEEWFDEPQEAIFFKEKRIRQVLNGCGKFYGVFTKAHCWDILCTLYPGQVGEEDLNRFWSKGANLVSDSRLAFWWYFDPSQPVENRSVLGREPDAVYDKIRLGKCGSKKYNSDKSNLDMICSVLYQDPSKRYMPSLAEFEQMVDMGYTYNSQIREQLYDALSGQNYYYVERGCEAECEKKIDEALMQEAKDEVFLEIIENEAHWSYYLREEKTAELMKRIKELRDYIPSILDYGIQMGEVAKNSCPSPARKEVDRQIQIAQEEEDRRKAIEAAKRESAKTLRKNVRSYGRKGRS